MMLAFAASALLLTLAGQAADPPSLFDATWVAVELTGTPVPLTPAERQPSLTFVAGGRVSGTDGCNRIQATYTVTGDRIAFGPIAATRMACPGMESLAGRFEAALKGAQRWRLVSGRLQLFGQDDALLVAFEARRGGATAGVEVPGSSSSPRPATSPPGLPLASRVFDWASLTPVKIPNGERRQVLDGPTATLDLLHVHITSLGVGQASGEPVRHPRDEVLIVKEGDVEVHLDGTTQRAGPGAILFFASGAVTRLKNVGPGPATYYVIYYETPKTPTK
jgi:heat shock protein HslJ/mannose-6-phosphate isomerase-like protein (cupin superfamily)